MFMMPRMCKAQEQRQALRTNRRLVAFLSRDQHSMLSRGPGKGVICDNELQPTWLLATTKRLLLVTSDAALQRMRTWTASRNEQ